MNFTLQNIVRKNDVLGGPFLQLNKNLCMFSSQFSNFYVPCLLSPSSLKIRNVSFKQFFNRVIEKSKYDTELLHISCASFKDIKTSKQGSIFQYDSCNVHIDKCSFLRVSSTSFPACFYITNSHASITKCFFSNCFCAGGDAKFGNAYFCYQCYCKLHYSYTFKCAPSYEIYGDSTISLQKSKEIEITFHNSSNSYGKNGASLISYLDSNIDLVKISYLTSIDSHEKFIVEITETKKSNISFSNFINGYLCSHYMFCNPSSEVYLSNCVFINPHSTFYCQNSIIFIDDCFSNQPIYGYSITTVNDEYRISFNRIFYKEPICGSCIMKKTFQPQLLLSSFLLYCIDNII